MIFFLELIFRTILYLFVSFQVMEILDKKGQELYREYIKSRESLISHIKHQAIKKALDDYSSSIGRILHKYECNISNIHQKYPLKKINRIIYYNF